MKIFIFNKKSIWIFLYIVLLSLFIIFYCFTLLSNAEFENFENSFMQKVQSITSINEKIAFLTFDDGPSKTVTPKVLKILQEENIPATFFVIGKSVEAYPEIVKQEYEDGHYIANHSYSHQNSLLYKNEESFLNEITKTENAIRTAINNEDYCSHLFRFPNGYMSPLFKSNKKKLAKFLLDIDYAFIDWNCLTKDSERKYSTSQLFKNLKETSLNKTALIVLMHDTNDVNDCSTVLKECITYLKEQGYSFKNFYDLFEDS